MRLFFTAFILIYLSTASLFSQIVDPFTIRYQTNQKGGLVFLANTTVGCNGCSANDEMPPGGTSDNNDFNMSFVDIDGDPSTFMSSSDQLALPNCSEVLFAGLYWDAILNQGNVSQTPNYDTRNRVKLSVNNGAYLNLVADDLIDNATGKKSYYAFKNITSIVQANAINSSYKVADVVTETGSNTYGGWTIVVVYRNIYETMKNLTVFDGLANVNIGGTVDIGLSGFLTPPTGAVNFELGVVAHDGDRAQTGDILQFNGAGSFVNISDALHQVNNVFNSTICKNGVLTPNRNPSYNNNLGHDANIYSPDNSSLNYIGNSATSASIRISTSNEGILTSVITSAIDIFEPDLRASVSFTDLNGGLVQPGDILEYSVTVKNIGSDVSTNTILSDTLDPRLTYIPGSIRIASGPNTGLKTDALDADQAEFEIANNVIKARIGTGATGVAGGSVINSSTGADSTVIKFRVQLINECAVWQCGAFLRNKAYVFGTGQISGITNSNNGASDLLDAQGCPSPESGLVAVNVSACAPLVINFAEDVCEGEDINLSFPNSAVLAISWTGPNNFSSSDNTINIPNAQVINGGNYVLHLSLNGVPCIEDTIATIAVHEKPTIQLLAIQQDTCFQAGGGFIRVSGNGTAPFSYSWSNSDSDSLAQGLLAGDYTVTVSDANNCSESQTFSINEPAIFTIDANITSNFNGADISCFGATNGSALATITGGTAPVQFSWLGTGIQTAALSNVGVGTYIVQASDGSGCIVKDTVVITQPTQINLVETITPVLCFGNATGAINVAISGGTPTYTSSWSNGTSGVGISNVAAGDYSTTVTDLNGCTATENYTIAQPSASLTLSSTQIEVQCFAYLNGAIDLTVNGGVGPFQFLWSNGATTEDLSNIAAGNYSVAVTDGNNCTTNQAFTISQPAIFTVTANITSNFNGSNISCFGETDGSALATITGGIAPVQFSWLGTANQNPAIANIGDGTYIIQATDNVGCIASDTIVLTQPEQLAVSEAITDVLCFGNNTGAIDLTIVGGTSPYGSSWSNGATSEDLVNVLAGNYTSTITDVNACTISNDYSIIEPAAALTLSTNSTQLLCNGDSNGAVDLSVSGGVQPYQFLWSNGAITEDLQNLTVGNYSVNVTDANNCPQTISQQINEPPALTGSFVTIDPVCQSGIQGEINFTPGGGVPNYTFFWNNDAITEDLTGLFAGLYSVQLRDENNCVSTFQTTLTDPDAVLIDETITAVLCYGNSTGAIDITATNGNLPYSYAWNIGSTNEDLSNLLAGQYSVNVTDVTGCGGFKSFIVLQPDTAIHVSNEILTDILCFGNNTGSVEIIVSGGTGPYNLLWNGGQTTPLISNLTEGTYSVTITDANLCSMNTSFTLLEFPVLVASETHTDVLCFGEATGTIDASVQGGNPPYNFSWDNGATTEDLIDLPIGVYVLSVTDANNCPSSVSSTIGQPTAALGLSAIESNVLCFGYNTGQIDLSVSGGTPSYTYIWSNSSATEDVDSLLAGSYDVEVTDLNLCKANLTVVITEPATAMSLTGTGSAICNGATNGFANVEVQGGTPGYLYQWSSNINDTLSTVDSLAVGSYVIVVTDLNNCKDSIEILVDQPLDMPGCVVLQIPNVFTPDDDKINDLFIPIKAFNIADFHLIILNRWGNVIFEGNDFTKGWDGMDNGKKASEGVYFWIIEYTDTYGGSDKLQGNLSLIRAK